MNQKQEREMIEAAVKDFRGDLTKLEGAIGTYFVGKEVGWKVLYLAHDKRTIRKYEEILGGLNFREIFPEEGRWAHKSIAYKAVQKVSNFWKAAKGETPGIRSSQMQ